jgi:hypothetical protein
MVLKTVCSENAIFHVDDKDDTMVRSLHENVEKHPNGPANDDGYNSE